MRRDCDAVVVVAWRSDVAGSSEIRARRFTALGVPHGVEAAVHPATAGNQFAPSVAMAQGGDFVVARHGDAAGSWDIAARRGELRCER